LDKKFQKFLAVSVTSALVVSAVSPMVSAEEAEGQIFTDVTEDMDGFEAIKFLKENDILSGYQDGSFKPYQSITRGQVAKVLTRALELEIPEDRGDYLFSDIDENHPDQELVDAIAAVSKEGIFSGKQDGKFYAYEKLTRQQMAKVLVNSFDLDGYGGSKDVDFSDEEVISPDLKEYVDKIAELEISIGKNGEYLPLEATNRKQFAQFLFRTFGFESFPEVTGIELGETLLNAQAVESYKMDIKELNSLDELTFYTNGIAENLELVVEIKVGSVLVRELALAEGQNYITLDLKALKEKHGELPAGAYYFNIKTQSTTEEIYEYDVTIEAVDEPIIEGVGDGEYYAGAVTPSVRNSGNVEAVLTHNGVEQTIFNLGESVSKEGVYVLTITDEDGDESQTTFTIDKTNPAVDVTGLDKDVYHYGEKVDINVSAEDQNFEELTVTLNGEEIDAATGHSILTDGSEDGDYTLAYEALDKAGNAINDSVQFTVDSSDAYVKDQQLLRTAIGDKDVDSVYLASDITVDDTLTFTRPLYFNGLNHTLTMSSTGYGIYMSEVDGIELSNFKLDATNVDLYGIKVEDLSKLQLSNVTVMNSTKSAIDLNGVSDSILRSITAKNTEAGVGLALTNSSGITLERAATENNAWGGIGVFGGSELSLSGDAHTFTEENADIYSQVKNDTEQVSVSTTDSNIAYKVTAPISMPGYTLYYVSEEDAQAAAASIGEDAVVESLNN
jgi:hypothetical protein